MHTVQSIKERITPICKHYGVKNIFLFGSYSRGDANESSDVDLRIDLAENMTGFTVAAFYAEIEDALDCKIDIMTTRQLPHNFLAHIKNEEIKIYGNSK